MPNQASQITGLLVRISFRWVSQKMILASAASRSIPWSRRIFIISRGVSAAWISSLSSFVFFIRIIPFNHFVSVKDRTHRYTCLPSFPATLFRKKTPVIFKRISFPFPDRHCTIFIENNPNSCCAYVFTKASLIINRCGTRRRRQGVYYETDFRSQCPYS